MMRRRRMMMEINKIMAWSNCFQVHTYTVTHGDEEYDEARGEKTRASAREEPKGIPLSSHHPLIIIIVQHGKHEVVSVSTRRIQTRFAHSSIWERVCVFESRPPIPLTSLFPSPPPSTRERHWRKEAGEIRRQSAPGGAPLIPPPSLLSPPSLSSSSALFDDGGRQWWWLESRFREKNRDQPIQWSKLTALTHTESRSVDVCVWRSYLEWKRRRFHGGKKNWGHTILVTIEELHRGKKREKDEQEEDEETDWWWTLLSLSPSFYVSFHSSKRRKKIGFPKAKGVWNEDQYGGGMAVVEAIHPSTVSVRRSDISAPRASSLMIVIIVIFAL